MLEQHALERRGRLVRRTVSIAEPQHARAQPANRPSRDFQHVDIRAGHPALGVNRTVVQADRTRRARHRIDHGLLHAQIESGRRDVNRLLEERTFERIGLVEDRERGQLSARQHALDRELRAGNVGLDENLVFETGACGADLGAGQQRADAPEGGGQLRSGIGSDHAPAPRKTDRLEHAREIDLQVLDRAARDHRRGERENPKARGQQPTLSQQCS